MDDGSGGPPPWMPGHRDNGMPMPDSEAMPPPAQRRLVSPWEDDSHPAAIVPPTDVLPSAPISQQQPRARRIPAVALIMVASLLTGGIAGGIAGYGAARLVPS